MVDSGKRKKGLKALVVDPYKQVKVGFLFLMLNLAFCFLLSCVFFYFFTDIINSLKVILELSPKDTSTVFAKYNAFIWSSIGLIVVFAIATVWLSFKSTHRIHGPLVSINRYLDQIAEGQTPDPLNLRNRDQLKELAAKINSAVEKLKQNS